MTAPPLTDDTAKALAEALGSHNNNGVDASADLLHRTDLGNARRLVAARRHQMLWVPQWGTWMTWDARRWAVDHKGQVTEWAKDICRDLWTEVVAEPDADRRKDLVRWATTSENANRIEAMTKLARTEPGMAVEPDELDANPYLLNVPNGTVDLRTGTLLAHNPDHLITKMAGIGYISSAVSTVWTAFLEAILPDPEVRTFVQAAIGYSLTGLTTEQVLFLLYGEGANGKSTLIEAVMAAMGDYAMTCDPELLMARRDVHPTGIADLQGARLVATSEIEDGRRLAEAQVKRLTGSDTIKARKMMKDFFSFTPTHTLWMHTNHKPAVRGTDHAMWRRIRLVPFTVTIPDDQRDKNLPQLLRSELSGILSWAVEGCRRWHQTGLITPVAVSAATAGYRADQDILGAFIDDRCIIGSSHWVSATQLYATYTTWCQDNGERVMSQKALGSHLTERGFDREKRGGLYRWIGLGIQDHRDDPGPLDRQWSWKETAGQGLLS